MRNEENIEQILYRLSLYIKIYSPEVNNILQKEVELNIISPRVNKFDIQLNSI